MKEEKKDQLLNTASHKAQPMQDKHSGKKRGQETHSQSALWLVR